ncbi:transglutaminase-like cysteine peptidase [uncultured Pseudoteredinibacter sp.]|uniref:transglutaminase-like cysteine peptidase n=1 Tax=uncultured Pseudoteredinibacter sp. TaxID=1641701 RepID=UPI00260856D6|nr:transglutaminase-like cysteine peptidase [uncultured Pseudoteredinibacter sp.]
MPTKTAPIAIRICLLCIALLRAPLVYAQEDPIQGIAALQNWASAVNSLRHNGFNQEQQLQAVNQYFNRFSWRSDRQRWQSDDHWSSSFDTIRNRQGDCEDLSIAKFTTLLALGFKERQLHLHYVYSRPIKAGHMVLSVRLENGRQLVLDSLSDSLSPLSQRSDLQSIYRFNREGLWIPKLSQDKRSHSLLPSWKNLLQNDPMLRNPELLSTQLASL